ncbi:MAG: murein L,D-transpeptidase [Dehalococcoidia bacterium]|nr:murein L,D-transpeptidase [Dehalococcoidia bacterium]
MVPPEWANVWYVLEDGSYVYSAFVFISSEAEVAPWYSEPGLERYVIVDLSDQVAWVMLGQNVMHGARISTGYGQFATPTGEFTVYAWGRIASAHMTSSEDGFDDSVEPYDVQRVLFTQYFAAGGFALHLNYWQPDGVFGAAPSSHGCVGMPLHEAQYLWLFGYAGMRVVVRP